MNKLPGSHKSPGPHNIEFEPVTSNHHDMAKLKGSVVEKILKKAGGVFGDKGFIGTGYITTPIRKPECRKLLKWEQSETIK